MLRANICGWAHSAYLAVIHAVIHILPYGAGGGGAACKRPEHNNHH